MLGFYHFLVAPSIAGFFKRLMGLLGLAFTYHTAVFVLLLWSGMIIDIRTNGAYHYCQSKGQPVACEKALQFYKHLDIEHKKKVYQELFNYAEGRQRKGPADVAFLNLFARNLEKKSIL